MLHPEERGWVDFDWTEDGGYVDTPCDLMNHRSWRVGFVVSAGIQFLISKAKDCADPRISFVEHRLLTCIELSHRPDAALGVSRKAPRPWLGPGT